MSNHAMVSASQFDPAKLTFRDLICHYGTGRVIHIDGRGASKQIQYRFGIQTEIGDFEVHEWMKLVRVLIERAGEEPIQQRLVELVEQEMPWLHRDFERQLEALELHARRIFENPEWVAYEKFNKEVAHECESKQ